MKNTDSLYLKYDKKVSAKHIEDSHEYYQLGIFQINISSLTEYVESNISEFEVIDVDIRAIHFSDVEVDADTFKPNPTPSVYAEISPYNYVLIDGHHRYSLAKQKGEGSIKCYKVPVGTIVNFFVSNEMYVKFIEYWNSKVDDYFECKRYENRIAQE